MLSAFVGVGAFSRGNMPSTWRGSLSSGVRDTLRKSSVRLRHQLRTQQNSILAVEFSETPLGRVCIVLCRKQTRESEDEFSSIQRTIVARFGW